MKGWPKVCTWSEGPFQPANQGRPIRVHAINVGKYEPRTKLTSKMESQDWKS